ncbi:methionine biosynthesis protein MetW [Caulobacter soli]|uniref:methionine biosynthesis protein MetW n=1 Tax=Caulobacter soli TaxID=2708539 RepID=UPI0013EB9E7F|nr:methionine biosynthesis protein MetW [Caulobacter soli]
MIREDFKEILRLVRPGSRVLDVGCGEGVLLDLLTQEKQVDGRGLEISAAGVAACMSRGLSVVQGDADQDLDHFPDRTFDYAVLSQTLQATRRPRHVLDELLRIADRAVVSFPNFGHWRVRWSLLHRGRMPETEALPLPWWSTPNIHLCTLADFLALTEDLDVRIDACAAFAGNGPARQIDPTRTIENWRAETCLFMLSRNPVPAALAEPPATSGDLFDG